MWARKGRAPSGAQRKRHWWRSAAARLKVAAVVQEDAEEEEEEEEPASRPCCCTSHVTGPRSASAWPGEGWKVIMITENSAYFGQFFLSIYLYLFRIVLNMMLSMSSKFIITVGGNSSEIHMKRKIIL